MTVDIETVRRFVGGDAGLATVSLARPDGTVHSSVVNAGVLDHPVTGAPVVGLVVRGNSWKLRRLRDVPELTVVFRVAWDWVSAEGPVDIIGAEDPFEGFDPADVPALLRDVFRSAGGTHDDWDEYDRVMASENRTAIFVRPRRFLARPGLT